MTNKFLPHAEILRYAVKGAAEELRKAHEFYVDVRCSDRDSDIISAVANERHEEQVLRILAELLEMETGCGQYQVDAIIREMKGA